ncbi:MAG TPA: glycosyltransferase family 39 protein, partial [bacterium]|nr:glycosyltransferase family 39 protein [bacterium]
SALLVWAFSDFFNGFLRIQKFPRLRLPGRLYGVLGGLGMLCFLLALLQGVFPDVYFGALVYHLSTLEFWKDHHGIADFYTNLYSYYPFGGELYFFNGYFFGGSEAAKLLNVFAAGLCGLGAAGWVAEETNRECGWLTWAMLLTLPLVSATVWTTQNDVLLAFFLILFFYALTRWAREKPSFAWAAAAGLLGGAALTVKYTAALGIFLGILTSLFMFRDLLKGKRKGGWLLILSLEALSLAPWFIRNSAYTGDAFYPYLSSLFGGRPFPAENMGALMGDHEAAWNGNFSWGNWIHQVLSGDLDKGIAPLLFGFIPFLFLKGDRKPVTRFLLVLGALWLVLGFLASHQPRLMIPAFVTALTALGLVLGELKNSRAASIGAWAVLFFGLASLLSLGRLGVNYYHSDKVWLGEQTRREYLEQAPQTTSYFGLAELTGKLLPPDSRLLVVGDARGLYYPRCFYTNSVFDEPILPKLAGEEKDGDGIARKLHEMGMDALVVSGEEGRRLYGPGSWFTLRAPEAKKLGLFIQRWTDPLVLRGGSGIYLLRFQPAVGRAPVPDPLGFYPSGT